MIPKSDTSIFLPSIAPMNVQKATNKNNAPRVDHNLLNFLDPQGLYHYPTYLYSAGHAELDIHKAMKKEQMVVCRDKQNTFVMVDSGGYQLATGARKIDFDHSDMTMDTNTTRDKILRYSEFVSDAAMILDAPAISLANPRSTIYQNYHHLGEHIMFLRCLEFTINNAIYYIKYRRPGMTKLLNVIQGRDTNHMNTGENDIWYECMKHFNDPNGTIADVKDAFNYYIDGFDIPKMKKLRNDSVPFGDRRFEGWAFPGNLRYDMDMLMKRLKNLYDDGFLTHKADDNLIIHFLGTTKLSFALLYTSIQKYIKRFIKQDVLLTYDASTPLLVVTKGSLALDSYIKKNKLSHVHTDLPKYDYMKQYFGKIWGELDEFVPRLHVGEETYECPTALSGIVTVDELFTNPNNKSGMSHHSYQCLMHMNTERHCEVIKKANQLWLSDRNVKSEYFSTEMLFADVDIESYVLSGFKELKSFGLVNHTTYDPKKLPHDFFKVQDNE